MIYILERVLVDEWTWNTITTTHVFEVPDDINVEVEYRDHILKVANSMSAVINPHWYNLMDHENHHPHLNEEEYESLSQSWTEELRANSKFSFLKSIGRELGFEKLSEEM